MIIESSPDPPGVSREQYRDALSFWATGVSIVAVRDDGDLHATTVGSFTSVSDRPPTVALSLTASARILPFLEVGRAVGVSVLGGTQSRIAAVYADPFPVGPVPFDDNDPPLIADALAGLACRVVAVTPVSGSFLVIAAVESVTMGTGQHPLIYYRRRYRALAAE